MTRRSRFDPDSEQIKEVMRRDSARIQRLWAAAKARYDGEEEPPAATERVTSTG